MANENEHDKRDTLAGISAEMRSYGERPPPRLMWLEIADRIDAIDRSDAWRRSYTPGNAAAMRDAMVEIETVAGDAVENKTMELPQYSKIVAIVEAALAKPARNCDIYNDVDTSWRDYKQFRIQAGEAVYFDMLHFLRYAKWLFETAAERKGEGDGRQ